VALAGIGLGLQAQRRFSAIAGALLSLIGWIFWIVQTVFVVQFIHSWTLILIAVLLALIFAAMLGLSCVAAIEMFRNPPPAGQDILPEGYKIPYSHYHEDPPEVRLERELAERRQRLAVQQKELEALEEKLHRKLNEDQS
jgi:hypothetical protein